MPSPALPCFTRRSPLRFGAWVLGFGAFVAQAAGAPLVNGDFEAEPFLSGWNAGGVISEAGLNGTSRSARLPFNTTATLSQSVDPLTSFTFDTYLQVAGITTAQSFRILLDSSAGNAIEIRGALGNILQVNHQGSYISATSVSSGTTFPIPATTTVRLRVIGRNFGSANADYDLIWSNPGSTTLSHAATGLKSFTSNAAATSSGGISRIRFDRNDTAAHSHWFDELSFVSGTAPAPAANYQIVTPNPPVSLPVSLPFTSTAYPLTPSPAGEWSLVDGVYRNTITGTSNTSAASLQTEALGGDPATAHRFFISSKFTVVASGSANNRVGFALFGSNSTFTGGVNLPYYLVDVKPSGSSVRVLRVGINNTQFLPDSALDGLTLDPAQPFTLEVVGDYENGVLLMTVTVRQNGSEGSFFVTDSEPLSVGWFGYRNLTSGGALTVDCDDFLLRHISTLSFPAGPPPFARAGVPYVAPVSAVSDVGAAVSLTAAAKPSWLAFTAGANGSGTLTGTPSAADLGSHTVTLAATDDESGSARKSFNISVIEPAGVMISEFLAENDFGLEDEDGEKSDWIELFNPGETTADIGGWFLSDDPLVPQKWTLPAGITLAPKGFLTVFASGKNRIADPARLHTNFKLSKNSGETLTLANASGSVVSSYHAYPAQRADRSYGAYGSYTPVGYLLNPTPGQPNDALGYAGFVADTKFSLPRGYLSAARTVALSCATPGATLVYTTDGSTPSLTNGTQGVSPLNVNLTGTTVLRVSAFAPGLAPSGPDTRSYFFLDDILTQGTPDGWPTGKVNGQVLDYGMDADVTSTVTVQEMRDSLASLPSLSLVTDLPNLLDPATGIYVNPYGREDSYERPVSVELINPDAAPGFQINAGLRIRGGASREGTNPKHNFHLYFRSQYGASKLNYPLFGDEGADTFDRVDLRTAQVMSWHKDGSTAATYTRDEWNRATHGAMGQPYTRSRYYHLYLNGVYWGVYGTQERADADFAASYLGGKKADYDVMKTYVIPHRVEAADGDNAFWTQLFNAAVAGFAGDAAYHAVQGLDPSGQASAMPPLLDMDNLIDYNLLRFYAGDDDAPVNTGVGAGVPKNFYALRPRDGRFGYRFLTHDAESCMRAASPNVNVTGTITAGSTLSYFNPRWLNQQLAANARFRLRFADRAQKHLFNGGALDTAAATARWNDLAAHVRPAMLAESARWGDARGTLRTVANFDSAVSGVATGFIAVRRANLIAQLRARNLFPSLDAPSFSIHGGNVASGSGITVTAPAGTTIRYTLDGSDPMAAGSPAYTGPITLGGVQVTLKARAKLDTTGEWSALTEADFTLDAIPAAPGNLAISEIHYNPPGASDDTEFVELVNLSSSRLNLAGVNFTGAMIFTFGDIVLEPGARLLVVESAAAFAAAYPAVSSVVGQWSGALNNSGDTVILRAANGTEIERVAYTDLAPWPTAADGDGYSLVRISDAAPADSATNWRVSALPGGNPGTTDVQSPDSWFAANGGGGALDDLNGDGLPALVEYALGLDLGDGKSPTLDYAPEPSTTPPTSLFTYRRRLAADGVSFVIETSPDLAAWSAALAETVSRAPNGDGTETVTVRLPDTGSARFVRLRLNTP
jgi:hypothetical protein